VDAARAGAAKDVEPLIDELCRASPEFRAMWSDNDVRSHGEAVKRIRHPVLGPIEFEYSVFAVDGRPDLSMVVYNPTAPADLERIQRIISQTRALDDSAQRRPEAHAPVSGTEPATPGGRSA
jgi:hypothetical protein